jgi:hypothetical protein
MPLSMKVAGEDKDRALPPLPSRGCSFSGGDRQEASRHTEGQEQHSGQPTTLWYRLPESATAVVWTLLTAEVAKTIIRLAPEFV